VQGLQAENAVASFWEKLEHPAGDVGAARALQSAGNETRLVEGVPYTSTTTAVAPAVFRV